MATRVFLSLAVALSVTTSTLSPATARADDDGACPAEVYGWVDEADAHNDARVLTRDCRGRRVVVTLRPTGADAYDVALEPCAVARFRRVGGLCLQPLMEVPDFSAIPAPQLAAFDQLVEFVEEHGARLERRSVGGGAPARLLGALGVNLGSSPLLLILAALLAEVARYRRRRLGTRAPAHAEGPAAFSFTRAALAVFALALTLRLALGSWSAHHVHLSVLWVVAATSDPTELVHFGPGYAEVFGWLTRLVPLAPDYALYAVNAVVGASLAPLGLWLARELNIDARRGLLFALVVACDPVSIRFGATEAYHPILLLLSIGSGALTVRAARLLADGQRLAAATAIGIAMLLAAQCARIHPAAWALVAFAPLLGLAAPVPIRTRLFAVAASALAVGGGVVLLDGHVVANVLGSLASGDLYRPTWQVSGGAAVLGAAALGVLAVSPSTRGFLPVAAAHLAVWALTRDDFGQTPLRQASYDRLHLLIPLLALFASVPARWAARREALWVSGACLALLVATQVVIIAAPRDTAHHERLKLRAFIHDLAEGCRVVHVAFAGRHGVFLPTYAATDRSPGRFIRLDGRRAMDVAAAVGDPECLFYVRTSLCATAPGRTACAEAEQQLDLEPVSSWSFDATPARDFPHATDGRVQVDVQRVRATRAR
jgi:hypothetical protein